MDAHWESMKKKDTPCPSACRIDQSHTYRLNLVMPKKFKHRITTDLRNQAFAPPSANQWGGCDKAHFWLDYKQSSNFGEFGIG